MGKKRSSDKIDDVVEAKIKKEDVSISEKKYSEVGFRLLRMVLLRFTQTVPVLTMVSLVLRLVSESGGGNIILSTIVPGSREINRQITLLKSKQRLFVSGRLWTRDSTSY